MIHITVERVFVDCNALRERGPKICPSCTLEETCISKRAAPWLRRDLYIEDGEEIKISVVASSKESLEYLTEVRARPSRHALRRIAGCGMRNEWRANGAGGQPGDTTAASAVEKLRALYEAHWAGKVRASSAPGGRFEPLWEPSGWILGGSFPTLPGEEGT